MRTPFPDLATPQPSSRYLSVGSCPANTVSAAELVDAEGPQRRIDQRRFRTTHRLTSARWPGPSRRPCSRSGGIKLASAKGVPATVFGGTDSAERPPSSAGPTYFGFCASFSAKAFFVHSNHSLKFGSLSQREAVPWLQPVRVLSLRTEISLKSLKR